MLLRDWLLTVAAVIVKITLRVWLRVRQNGDLFDAIADFLGFY